MEITYHNGKKIETNDYITLEKDSITELLLDGHYIDIARLPKLLTPDYVDLRYLNYGARTFVICKNTREKVERFYTYEQKIVHNKMEVVDYMATTIIPFDNPLKYLIDKENYSKEYEISAMCDLTSCLERVNFIVNPYNTYGQIINFVFPVTKDTEYTEPKEDNNFKGKSLQRVARETGIPYGTLWNRTHLQKLTVEEAVAMGRKPRGGWNKKKVGKR